jgi:phosphomannomutase
MKEFACFHQIIQEDSVIFKDRTKVFDYAKTHLPAFPQSGVTRKPITNNFKYYFANGDWALLRFSGTEPLVRLFAETASEADGKEDIQAIRQMILEAEK